MSFGPGTARTPSGEVWVVDDSPTQSRLVEQILTRRWSVARFATGAAMLDRLTAGGRPDVVVLDWNLPEMSGREVCRALRAHFEETSLPVLVLTGEEGSRTVVEALDAGANDFLRKPPTPEELIARVSALARVRLLGAVSEIVAATTDEQDMLRLVADLLVPAHVDGMVVHLVGAEGEPARCAYRRGEVASVPDATRTALAEEVVRCAAVRRHVEPSGRDLVAAPLVAHGVVLGALVLVGAADRHGLEERRTALAGDVARRLGIALDNARLLALTRAERQRAEEANASKDQFIGMVSHELRTPLNAIVGWGSILRGNAVDPQQVRGLDTILRNARLQVQLVEDLLDVTRIAAGKLQLQPTWVEPGPLVEMAVETARPLADAKSITLDVTADPAAKLWADGDRLQQVVGNLLSNAIKFTPEGGRVDVDLADGPKEIVLRVTDTGRGMEPSFLPFVFDRFKQAEGGSARQHGGLGLGLAIVRHIIEEHEGRISAHSEGLGRGSTFEVVLPRREGTRRTIQAVKPQAGMPAERPQLAGVRVLVVDDERDSLELVETLLRASGMDVVGAGSAAEALGALETHRFDIVVSDISMPGEDGLSFVRKLRNRGGEASRMRAVALTSLSGPEDRRRSLAAGFDVHVAKPVDLDELLLVIQRMAELRGRREPG